MSDLPKYQVLTSDTASKIEDEMNALVDEGYKLHSFTVASVKGEHIVSPHYVAVMSLSSAKYDDIEGLRDVPPGEANKLLSEGWIVADSYSKFIRMVKKK